MGTTARYIVWVGFSWQQVQGLEDPERSLLQVLVDQKLVQTIYMHGEEAGVGLAVFELDWTAAGDEADLYPSDMGKKIEVAKSALTYKLLFNSLDDLTKSIKTYHLIDLGG